MPTIKLQSSCGEIFEVDVEIAKQSVTIKTMLEDLGMDDEADVDPIPLDFPGGAVVKNPPANAGHMGLIPGLGGSHMPQSC
uniref:SKP1 component POZ domain-containing protein n=1 Tax=Phocoena sinus TaxID=42100 RepID=A0A8C9BU91_PHOSS